MRKCNVCGLPEKENADEETACEAAANLRRLQSIYGPELRGYNGAW